MAQVSPAINEVQTVETTSWNSPARPSTSIDNLDVTITDSSPSPSIAEAYSVTTGDTPGELGCPEPLTPTDNLGAQPSEPMLASALEGTAVVNTPKDRDRIKSETSQPSKKPRARSDESLGDVPLPAHPPPSPSEDRRQHSRASSHPSQVEATVEAADLWRQFYQVGTEMIITRAGRRMFPGVSVSVKGLEPESKYTLALEINPADSNRYKYLNGKWVVVGKSDSHCEEMLKYTHPDSPASGRHWMANKVSFKKIKVTNNKSNKRGHITLNSMHRYLPRLVISKHISKKNIAVVHTQEFPECSFIAVTAYQNDKVTQLKIDFNPFAKAFRDNPNEPDMYGYQGMVGTWPPASPLLHPYPYSPDATGPLPSPSLQHPTPSPLPQFANAFGMWESPPCTPNAYRTQGLSGGAMLSPGVHSHTPSPLPQFSTAFQTWESPPYSPTAYRAQGINGGHHASVGYAPSAFQPGCMVRMPPPLPHNSLVSQQLMAGGEVALTVAKIESLTDLTPHEPMDQ